MKRRARMRVYLNPYSTACSCELLPKGIQPRAIELESISLSVVSGMNDLIDELWSDPRTRPEYLALSSSLSATAELGERLVEHHRWKPIPRDKRQPISLP